MTHGLGRVQLMGEVNILDRHVSSQDEVVPTLDRHQRCIIANTEFQPSFKPRGPCPFMPGFGGRQRLQPLNELVFGSKQVVTQTFDPPTANSSRRKGLGEARQLGIILVHPD